MIRTSVREHVLVVELDNPDRLNALSTQDFRDLTACWDRLMSDDDLRVAVIHGAGERAFSVGADVKVLEDVGDAGSGGYWSDPDRGYGVNLEDGRAVWKPVIAAIHGYCVGGGLVLALGADMRLASADATFSLPEVKLGVNTVTGAALLAGLVGRGRASRLALTGDRIDAAQAESWGLIDGVLPDRAALLEAAFAVADRIAANAPRAVQAVKEIIVRSESMHLRDVLALGESMRQVVIATNDYDEGLTAFREKRAPVFTGS